MRCVCALLLLWTLSVSAETVVSKFASGQPLLEKKSETPSEPSLPNPMNLAADWWRFFEAEPTVLDDRIAITIRQLKALFQEIPEDRKANVKTNLDRIIDSLQVLRDQRKVAGPKTPAFQPAQINYTLKQWLDIVHKRRAVQAELQSENEDLLRDESRINVSQQDIDSLTAAYLALPNQSNNKVVQGFALMAAWSEQALSRERLRLKKATLAMRRKQMEQLVEETLLAQDRLLVNEEDLQRLKQEIETAERELSSAHENVSKRTASLAVVNPGSDEGKARALLFEQQVRHSAIREAIAAVVAIRKKIELKLAQLLAASDHIELDEVRKQLQDSSERIGEITAKRDLWREETERDQGRTEKSLAALLDNTAQHSSELSSLTQQRLTEVQNTLLSLQRLESEINDADLVSVRVRVLITGKEGALKSGLETVKTSSAKVMESLWDRLGSSLFKIGETPVTTLGIMRVLLIITIAWALSHFVRRGLAHLSERQGGTSTFLYTLGRLAHYLILIIGISIGLSSIGVDLSNFALIAGALSLGIGFGLQAIVSNFVSGLIVLFERSLRIGDFVELSSGVAGEVRAINVRSTLVTTTDMVDILVPNSEFVNGKVINWTLTDASRRIHIPFGVAYGSNKVLVRKAGLEAAEQTPYTIKNRSGREPEVWLTNFGDSSLDFELVVWVEPQAVKKPHRVRAAYYWELETALRKYGIEIPFPQRDIHLRSGLKETPVLSKDANHFTETKRD